MAVLKLVLNNQVYECQTASEFDALLQTRLAPSSEKLAEVVALDENGLLAAQAAITAQEKQLDELAAAWMLGRSVHTIGRNVAADHGWDLVLLAVDHMTQGREGFSFVAVERYRQYLRGLHQCLEGVARGRLNPQQQSSSGDQLAALRVWDDNAPQRLLFDLRQLSGDEHLFADMERLPKGEPVRVNFSLHQSLALRLASYDFTLVSGADSFLLIDDTGNDIRLRGDRAVIGRGASCGAVLNARYRSVSRKHLKINILDDGTAYLTDISSMGTYMPTQAFA